MCMNSVYFTTKGGVGYKVFDKDEDDNYCPPCQGAYTARKNVWLHDKVRCQIKGFGGNVLYPTGFHIFVDEQDARNFYSSMGGSCICEVKFKNVVALGDNDGLCVIARSMKIVKELDIIDD